ncbi:type IV toxin-antitoxin system AbiEi family antitoxin domain-containing protein [Cellulomonas edaphi]|uniref:Type IV toxin-antitoxin system AbiEi family antitoxin domain-containing protein n=1 Tax=Cellulomonas edaphi TaxID=3053468 RepID=A0ABT7S3E7_9CELL|nr:type IV toxin-antitoxin system AbiEi family antitoxin domain-containing protein [Cellulomons edaphi]MDM7830135.1 type IV toxin-antitoxin system AbiEi family antitoxin domain-containing protein [Cellulomons edaphi]
MVSYAAPSAPAAVQSAAAAVVARQGGVATARQLVSWGWSTSAISRKTSSGQWQRLHRGVVLLHSGPQSWRELAHAALLYVGPGAALSHSSAAFVHGLLPRPGPLVEVSVAHERWIRPTAGVVIHRPRRMPFAVGRLRSVGEDATVVDLLHRARGTDAAVQVVAGAVLKGLLPDRILTEAASRTQLRHRRLLAELLGPGSDAIESPLEFRYGRDVERAHRLPRGATQVRQVVAGRWIRADRVYTGKGVRVELDGQLAHPFGATDDDVWRDNSVVLAHDEITLRYRWTHVAVSPCTTAVQVATALRRRGWPGNPRPCSDGCAV